MLTTDRGAPGRERAIAKTLHADYSKKPAFLDDLGTTFTFQTFDDKKKHRQLARVLHGTLADLEPELELLNRKGAGVYVTINETDLRGREAENIIRVRALFLDLDEPNPNRTFDNYHLPPSAVIESSPGKHQVYWILENNLPLSEFRSYQKALIEMFGGDPKIIDLPRVMRVPGFYHHKGKPFLVRQIKDTGLTYTVEEVGKWLSKHAVLNEEIPASEAPKECNYKIEDQHAMQEFDHLILQLESAEEGSRNDTLNRIAYKAYGLAHAGRLSTDTVTKMLTCTGQSIGLEESEVCATLQSALRKAPPVVNDLDLLPVIEPEINVHYEFDNEILREPSKDINNPPGLTGKVADYIFQSSRRPVKSYAIAGALTFMSHLNCNYAYVKNSHTSLNLYQCLIGDTGKGKEDPRKAIKRLIDAAGVELASIHESIASGPALLRSLEEKPSSLILIDEFGMYLQNALSDKGSIHQKDFITELMIFYGLGRSFFSGKAYADKKQNIGRINNPYINLLGTTTPLELLEGITPKTIDNGFLNRILFIEASKEYQVNRELDIQINDELKQMLQLVHLPITAEIDYENGAHDLLVQLVEARTEEGQFANLWSRVEEQVIRVAGLLAIGDGNIIKNAHVLWAWDYVTRAIETFAQKLDADLAENPFQKQTSRALDVIRNARNYSNDKQFGAYCRKGLMPRGKLTKLLKAKPKEVAEVVNYLIDTKQIKLYEVRENKCYSVLQFSSSSPPIENPETVMG